MGTKLPRNAVKGGYFSILLLFATCCRLLHAIAAEKISAPKQVPITRYPSSRLAIGRLIQPSVNRLKGGRFSGYWLAAGLFAGVWALCWRLGKRSRLTSTDEAICAISVLDPYTPSVHRDAYHGVGPADARAYNCPIGLTVLSPCM